MSDISSKSTRYYAKVETTNGVAETLTAANAFDVEAGIAPMSHTIEKNERNQLSAGEGKSKSKLAARSSALGGSSEFKCSDVVGGEPELAPIYQSGLGGKKVATEKTVVASVLDNQIQVAGASTHYRKGMVLTVERDGIAFFSSAILSVAGDLINFVSESAGFEADDKVRPVAAYFTQDSKLGKPSLTVLQTQEGTKHTKGTGMRPDSISIGAEVYGLPKCDWNLTGLDSKILLGQTALESAFQNSTSNTISNAPVLINGEEYEARSFTVDLANSIANKDITARGRIANRINEYDVTGAVVIYSSTVSSAIETAYKNNDTLSFVIIIPDSEMNGTDDYGSVASVAIMKATITNISYGDESMLGITTVEFQGYVDGTGDSNLVLSFS